MSELLELGKNACDAKYVLQKPVSYTHLTLPTIDDV